MADRGGDGLYVVKEYGVTIPITTAKRLEFRRIAQIVMWNAGATSVWVRMDGSDATTAWPSREIPAGQPRVVILTPENGDAVLSAIAATGAVNVSIQEFRFRSSLIAELVGAASLLATFFIQSFWEAVSATAVRLAGAYTEARADTVRNKTAGTSLQLTVQSYATEGIGIGDVTPVASRVDIGRATGGRYAMGSTGSTGFVNLTAVIEFISTYFSIENAVPFIMNAGYNADPRHTLNSTDRIRHTPVAGGNVSQVMDTADWVIKDAVVVTVNDLVEIDGSGNRVQLAGASSTGGAGIVLSGGTGNPAGTVMARVREIGVLVAAVAADVAGVTAGQYVFPGATNPTTRLGSKATIEGSIGKCLLSAGGGALTDYRGHGGL